MLAKLGRAVEAARGIRHIVDRASARFGLSALSLWPQAVQDYARGQFSLAELNAYASFVPEVRATLPVVISKQASLAKLRRINSYAREKQTEDKALFYAICASQGIAHPRVTGVIGGGARRIDGELPQRFISKDLKGAYARGFATFERAGPGDVRIDGGAPEPLDAVLDRLEAGERTLLLQERLFDHPVLEAIAGKPGLQTMRINSYRPPDGPARLLFWMIKLVVGDNVSDNFSGGRSGNLIAFGERDCGHLLGARRLHESGVGLATVETHPVTGARFDSMTVPLWHEAVACVLAAHESFTEFGALGWDVAVTADGPRILEANAWWDPPTYAPWLMTPEDWRLIFG